MFMIECLTELKDIFKDKYKNGGIDSVNFMTQGGRFYYETEDQFLEDLGQLSLLIKTLEQK